MQFKAVALFAVMASVAAAKETVTVYACPASSSSSSSSAAGYATPTIGTVGSTGVMNSPTATGSPITYATTGAASVHGVSALGLSVAGVIALFL
ncbi:hypothetical protein BGZ57DRAFT_524202 [Hyaloscypha finlandica]|nr:hypothetical protein BGZ57DRAFT_524202 [Hyaloscypha finlandica]KAH8814264.1 hypothetical protein F5882DRAFT_390078 [Hyaloscypha sp. PMI_1271]